MTDELDPADFNPGEVVLDTRLGGRVELDTDEARLKRIEAGAQAAALLENPAVKAAFEGLRKMALKRVEEARNQEEAYRATLYLQQLTQVRQSLEVAVSQGVSAATARYAQQEAAMREQKNMSRVRDGLMAARRAREDFDRIENETEVKQ